MITFAAVSCLSQLKANNDTKKKGMTPMSTKLMKTILGGALAALFAFTPVVAFGHNKKAKEAIVGLWDVTVTQVNCQTGSFVRSFPSGYMFGAGGTLTETGTGAPPSQRTTGLGTWDYSGGQTYTTALKFFRFLPDGTFAGTAKATASIELSQDGNALTATSTVELADTGGNVIATFCTTQTATRVE